jgi:tRNA-2-methylthio-N6-dimethylallyladenosine synthase
MTDSFVDDQVIQTRFARLAETQNRISKERNQEMLGRRVEVLSEGQSKKHPEAATTRTRTGKVVHVDGEHPPGSFLDVEIVEAAQHHLLGRLR